MTKKVVFLFAGLFAIAALWTAGWHIVKARIDAEITQAIRTAGDEGTRVACLDRRITGFPFHFDIICDRVAVERPDSGASFLTAGLRTTSLVYRPNHILAEIKGPAALRSPALGQPVAIDWSLARLSVRTDFDRLVRGSFAADGLDAALDLGRLSASRLESHVAPGGETSSKLALRAAGIVLTPAGEKALPPADLSLAATVELPVGALGEPSAWRSGVNVDWLELRLDSGAFALLIDGPVRLDPKGQISGTLKARATGLERLAAFDQARMSGEIDDVQRIAAALASAFGLVGVPAELDGRPARSISIVVRDGKAFASFIPLGRIPPLF